MTHPPGNPPSDPGGGDGTTGPGRTRAMTDPNPMPTDPIGPGPTPAPGSPSGVLVGAA